MRRHREGDHLSVDLLPNWLQWPELRQFEARNQEPLPSLPRRCRVPKLWAILNCFPRPQAGSWMGSGASGTQNSAYM